jgi:dihydrofolate reductase
MGITVINHLTLDGVMQGPGRPDEDTRGGFKHGGWAQAGNDDVMGRYLGERMARGGGALLFGRRTYEDLLSFWNTQPDSPFTPALNNTTKYVASSTLSEPLPWPNSTLLTGDVTEAVAKLKRKQPEASFGIMGSRTLIHALMVRNLIDEWLLMIHPLVLGNGLRLFDDESPSIRLTLIDSLITTTGVVIATYRTTGRPERG